MMVGGDQLEWYLEYPGWGSLSYLLGGGIITKSLVQKVIMLKAEI